MVCLSLITNPRKRGGSGPLAALRMVKEMATFIQISSLPVEAKWPMYVHYNLCTFPTRCTGVLRRIRKTNSNYFCVPHQQIRLYNERAVCFLLIKKRITNCGHILFSKKVNEHLNQFIETNIDEKTIHLFYLWVSTTSEAASGYLTKSDR